MGSPEEFLVSLEKAVPGLPIHTPTSPQYPEYRFTFFVGNPAVPLAIVRPRTAEDVAAIVPLARSHGIKFSVRTGGHDLFGRSVVDGALLIDMRPLTSVEVSQDRKTVKIGGGHTFETLVNELTNVDLFTPFGAVLSVGYVGWATLGGYNLMSANFGMGVDQIVGAKVVNWKGEIVQADADLLKGIRGGGGNFGVIVELEIKVYSLKKLFSGLIIYDSSNIAKVFQDVFRGMQTLKLPNELGLVPIVVNHPEMGRTFIMTFVWTSNDIEKGKEWLDRTASLGPMITNTVAEQSPFEWLKVVDALIASGVYGSYKTVNFSTMSEKISEVFAREIAGMPANPCCCINIHRIRGASATEAPSCFGERRPHFMIELIGGSKTKDGAEETCAWIDRVRREIIGTGETLKGEYVSLSSPGDVPVSDCFGDKWETLLELKRKYDPEGVFDLAVPRLGDYR